MRKEKGKSKKAKDENVNEWTRGKGVPRPHEGAWEVKKKQQDFYNGNYKF